jgi:hypothetical protein
MRTNKQLIFKPSGFTWRLGKCEQTNSSFSSQVASLGGSENAIKRASHTRRDWQCDLSLLNRAQAGQSALACESPSIGKLW